MMKKWIALLLAVCMLLTCTAALADREVSFPGSGLRMTLPGGFEELPLSAADIADDMLCSFSNAGIMIDVWEWENDGSSATDLMAELTDGSVSNKSVKQINGLELVIFEGKNNSGRFVGCIWAGNTVLYMVFTCGSKGDVKTAKKILNTLR